MPMYNSLQEIFDASYKGMAKQGWDRSLSPGGTCLYRSGNGLKCAIGVLIPDDIPVKEVGGVHSLFARNKAVVDLFLDHDDITEVAYTKLVFFLTSLQNAHDNCSFPYLSIQQNFEWVANRYDLSIPKV